jgi:hypothetical protein
MVREHLSQKLKDAGRQLLATTDALEMQAQGAMWLYDHVLHDWRYYLVTSLVDTIGRRKTYRLLLEAVETVALPHEMTIEDVHLGSPADDLFRFVSQVVRVKGGQTEFRNCVFNGLQFDGVIYRSVTEVPSAKQAERIEKRFAKRVKDLPRHARKHNSLRTPA